MIENGGAGESGGLLNLAPPLIGDSADKNVELSKAKKIQGWTVEEWLAHITKRPDCTLPGGVGGAIVSHFRHELAQADADHCAGLIRITERVGLLVSVPVSEGNGESLIGGDDAEPFVSVSEVFDIVRSVVGAQ